jgi:hypothetical protein
MAKFYTVTFAVNQGPYPPSIETTYHDTLEEAQKEAQVCLDSAPDDPYIIELVEVDTVTKVNRHLDTWEGTYDDLEGEEE